MDCRYVQQAPDTGSRKAFASVTCGVNTTVPARAHSEHTCELSLSAALLLGSALLCQVTHRLRGTHAKKAP